MYKRQEGIRAAVGDKAEVLYERGYVGDVTGDYNGVVTGQDLSEGRSGAQLLADAIAAARKVDAVVFIGGLNKGDHQDSEGADRLDVYKRQSLPCCRLVPGDGRERTWPECRQQEVPTLRPGLPGP